MNLLIVNDEELTAETMKQDMEWERYGIGDVFTAYDAEQAKAVIRSEHIDIMLCDIEMPGDNGIELLRWVRGEQLPIECIFLTCHPSFDYAKEAISLDCQDYILIPAMYEDIGQGVQKVVNRIEQKREELQYAEYGKRAVQKQVEQAAETHGKKKSAKELAGEVEDYIIQHLGDENLSVNELGTVFFMHPVYMNRIFKKQKEISVSQFITEERMKLALSLLKSGQISMNTVAEQVGYKGYANFCNAFKKYFGSSPSEYLKKHE
ncbi:MAG: response regulator [Lachnospiraceae bacterium]|nr:response regulator [Lachnospiraceae bacterium]